jgi:hypothetical protein
MKKNYYQPITEIVVLNLGERLTWGDDAKPSQPWNTGDAKENIIIFEEIVEEEEPDTTSIWNSNPWDTKYSLWDED